MLSRKRKGEDEKWMLNRTLVSPVAHINDSAEVNSGGLKGICAKMSPLIPYAKC